jgi:hypothetical protein
VPQEVTVVARGSLGGKDTTLLAALPHQPVRRMRGFTRTESDGYPCQPVREPCPAFHLIKPSSLRSRWPGATHGPFSHDGEVGLLEQLAEVVPGIGATYRSGDARGLLLPVTALTAAKGEISGQFDGVLFVEPPTGSAAAAVLDQINDVAGVVVALPAGSAPRGLVTAGSLTLPIPTDDRAHEFRLFRYDPLASGPAPGEAPNGLEGRARWFGKREG